MNAQVAKFKADFSTKLDAADFRPLKKLVDDALAREAQVTRKEFLEFRHALEKMISDRLRGHVGPEMAAFLLLDDNNISASAPSENGSSSAEKYPAERRQGANMNVITSQLAGLEKGVRRLCERDAELQVEIDRQWKALK